MNRFIQNLTDAAKHVKLPHRKNKEEAAPFYEEAPRPVKENKKGLQSTPKSTRAKKLVLVNLVGIGFLGGLFLYTHMDDRPDAQQNPQQTTAQSNKKTLPPLNLVAYANPFVDVQAVKKEGGTIPVNGPLPQIPAMQQAQHISGGSSQSSLPAITRSAPLPSLPAIPQNPAPNVPTASPMPLPSGAPAAQPPKPSQQASVQGVITGEDGENMAIMSDGSVVSEGETYQDGRIAYIGGDGITFDDGSSLKYGN